ncbi:hypothetical protein KCU76_g107, partial [Aureobasidium melanogenum]
MTRSRSDSFLGLRPSMPLSNELALTNMLDWLLAATWLLPKMTRSMLPADWSRRSDYFQRHVTASDQSIDLYRPRLQRVFVHCMNCRGKLVSEERAPFLIGKPRLGFTPRLKAGFLSQLGALSMSKSRYVA